MEVRLSKQILDYHGDRLTKKPYSLSEGGLRYSQYVVLDLRQLSLPEIQQFRKMIGSRVDLHGAKVLVRDVDNWIEVVKKGSAEAVRARTVSQAEALLISHIRNTPHQHVYERIEEGAVGVTLRYYVEEIEYHKSYVSHGTTYPERVSMDLCYEEFGVVRKRTLNFYAGECLGKSPIEILLALNMYTETPELNAQYAKDVERWNKHANSIGKQFLAVGVADDRNIDGNKDHSRWSSYHDRAAKLRLDKDGVPARVVIDVYRESDDSKQDRDEHVNTWFWRYKPNSRNDRHNPEWEPESSDGSSTVAGAAAFSLPVHPYLAVFDLARHKRLRIHVGNITEYKYPTNIRKKLVLPKQHLKLIDTLLAGRSAVFQDVIANKAGGHIVLCQGPPGTGKTLTAEVYAEAMKKPLYSIQCAQLGVKPEELEENLMTVLNRGRRWGAVTLLDEADVYVCARGTSLTQNAIVGVFLRVLEYFAGTLFLTTNRGDLVDDAILSRCIARIAYGIPSTQRQKRIWRVMAAENKLKLSDKTVEAIVAAHPKLSGRDIKNLLRLAQLMAVDRGVAIDVDLISEAKLFKPTTTLGAI